MFVDIWDEIADGLHAVIDWVVGLGLGGRVSNFFRRLLGLPAKQVGGDGSVQIQAGRDLYVGKDKRVVSDEDFDVRLKRAEIAETEKKVREYAERVEHYLGVGSSTALARYFKKEMDQAAARLERHEKELEVLLRGR